MFNALRYWNDSTFPARVHPEQDIGRYALPIKRQAAIAMLAANSSSDSEKTLDLRQSTHQNATFVCVLLGYAVSVLLRPKVDHYLLIGEIFIHGFMSGEAMKMKRKREQEVKDFALY